MKTSFFEDLTKSFFYKVIGLGITFGIQIFIARVIGIQNYGVWNTALSWMQIIFIISFGGNIKSLLRSASASQSDAFNKLINIGIQVLSTYIILYGVYWFFLNATKHIDSREFFLAIAIAFFLGLMKINSKLGTSMVQAIQKNYLSILIQRVYLPIAKAVFIGLLFVFLGDHILILSSYPISEAVAVLIFFYFVIKNFPKIEWKWNSKFYFNFHFWINDITKSLLPFINIALLSFIITDNDIGGYSASYRIGEFLMFFTTIFISFSPVIVRYIKNDKWEELQKAYLTINKILLVIVFPFFLFLLVFGQPLLSVFGESFSKYSFVLQILIIGVYSDAVTGPIGEMLNMSGNEHIEKNINIGATIINIFLIFLLGKYFGVIGAAIAFSLPRAFANILKLVLVKRTLEIETFKAEHLLIIASQIVLVIPFLFIDHNLAKIVVYFVSLVIFGLLLYNYEWVKWNDFKRLQSL